MSTFTCTNQCEEYCGQSCKSRLVELEKKLLNEKPPDWPLAEKSAKWSSSEKKSATEALTTIPNELVKSENWNLFRMERSVDHPNPASNGNTRPSSIVLYNSAFGGKYNLSRVLSHEFAHIYYENLSPEDKEDYQLTMNWFKANPKGDNWVSRNNGFVSEDGKRSPEEDFANNLEFYLYDAEKLKKIHLTHLIGFKETL
jgi:hypothetical protein